MKTTQIGTSAFVGSQIALGIMRADSHPVSEIAKLLQFAVDRGINFFDNADIYGGGKCEEIFGAALREAGIARDKVIVQTKVGIRNDEENHRYDFSKAHLIAAVDASLKRLDMDYADIVLVHRPDPLMNAAEVGDAFNTLRAAGKVREFGVSNFNPLQVELVQQAYGAPLVANQLQLGLMHTGMIDRGIHVNMTDPASVSHDGGIYEYSQLHHMTIQAWSPYQAGFFEGGFLDNPKYPEVNAKLQEMADKYHTSKSAIAAAWILRLPVSTQVIAGTMNQAHLQETIDGADIDLAAQDWYDLYYSAGHDLP